MLYPKNDKPLPEELFKNPTSEYRGAPFWAWNTKLNKEVLKKQIMDFKEMGMGGFHIHSRIGLDVPYLGEEFMELVRFCNNTAKEEEMHCWLYDEDKWPSGTGGGFVTQNPEYKSRFLMLSPNFYPDGYVKQSMPKKVNRLAIAGDAKLLARYEVILDNGYLKNYKKLSSDEAADENTWYVYRVIAETSPWFNNQSYVDTLNPKAIQKFVDITHKAYYEAVGDDFSGSIPAIFTDEPQFSHKDNFSFSYSKEELKIPYTDDLEETFVKSYGFSLMDKLPELFWELPEERVSYARYCFHDHICERFVSAFVDTIGGWCREHNIMLSGHVMEEATLNSQTGSLGEAMRCYRNFQLPGIDMLANRYEYTTAKQAQSVSRQMGRSGVISELYGVTNWDFDFQGHKLQGDWQAALGVTTRVHHLGWVGMGGEAKRDYPAPIDAHSPWYKQYKVLEDYYSRLNTALSRGKASVSVGVIHPIESYWLFYGPNDQTGSMRKELDQNFNNITKWLLFDLIDFDFIAESLLKDNYVNNGASTLQVGQMGYDIIIVPSLLTIRSTTLDILEEFAENGGKVVFAGNIPKYVDAKPSERAIKLSLSSRIVQFANDAVISELKDVRELDIRLENGNRTNNLIYQIRNDNGCKWLFTAQGSKLQRVDVPHGENHIFQVKGEYAVEYYDAMTGEIKTVECEVKKGWTSFTFLRYEYDSMLFKLSAKTGSSTAKQAEADIEGNSAEVKVIESRSSYRLDEPNVLLLDMAKYRFDNGTWMPREEILRIDNLFRNELGYSLRTESFPQPWLTPKPADEKHKLSLLFEIESEAYVPEVEFAYEGKENVKIIWNGNTIDSSSRQWFIDRAINKVKLGSLNKGTNTLLMEIPFGVKTDVEWCYLLGQFGVRVQGSSAVVTELPKKLYYGDYSRQFLPFYGGNVIYNYEFETEKSRLELEVPHFSTPVLEVLLDGESKGNIFLSPYRLDLGVVAAGKHKISIKSYGNRFNMFGQVHNCDRQELYYGPKTWRTEGAAWSYEYKLRPVGVLSSPVVYISKL